MSCNDTRNLGSSPMPMAQSSDDPHNSELSASESISDQAEDDDVYQRLAQKERDLILAAELGKALLDSNQELQARYNQTVEEYSLKVEELQQEKHGLHLELEKIEREYQNAIKDLQDDVASLQKQVREGAEQQVVEKESSRFLREAQRNIDYLMEQIKKATTKEEELMTELEEERKKNESSLATMQDQVEHINMLREQVEYLSEKLKEATDKLEEVQHERDGLSNALETTQEVVQISEAKLVQLGEKIQRQDSEIEELQESNCDLQQQINHLQSSQQLKLHHSSARVMSSLRKSKICDYSSSGTQPQSLFNELSSTRRKEQRSSIPRKEQRSSIPRIAKTFASVDQKTISNQRKPKTLTLDIPNSTEIKDKGKECQTIQEITLKIDQSQDLPLHDHSFEQENNLHTSFSPDSVESSSVCVDKEHIPDATLATSQASEQSLFAELCSSLGDELTKLPKPSHRRTPSDCSLSSLTEGSRKRQHEDVGGGSDESDEEILDRSGCKHLLFSEGPGDHQRLASSHNSSFDNDAGVDNPFSELNVDDKLSVSPKDLSWVKPQSADSDGTDQTANSCDGCDQTANSCDGSDQNTGRSQCTEKSRSGCGSRLRDLPLMSELSPVNELPSLDLDQCHSDDGSGDDEVDHRDSGVEQSLFSELSSQLCDDKADSESPSSGCAMGVFDFSAALCAEDVQLQGRGCVDTADDVTDLVSVGDWNPSSAPPDILDEDDFECDDDDFLVGNMEGTTLSISGGGHSLMYYSPTMYSSGHRTNIQPEFFSFDKDSIDGDIIEYETTSESKSTASVTSEQEQITEACRQLRDLLHKAHAGGLGARSAAQTETDTANSESLLSLIAELRVCVESACMEKEKHMNERPEAQR